jgi:AraC-like DNA-binding protein
LGAGAEQPVMRSEVGTEQSFSFSSRGLAPGGLGEALDELRQRRVMTVEPLPGRTRGAAIRKRFMPGAGILSGALCGLRQFGTAGGGDTIFLSLNLKGESFARECGREASIGGGDALFFSGGAGCTIDRPTPVRFAAMRLPYRALKPLIADPGDAAMRLIPKETGALRLLAGYLRAIDMGLALDDSPELRPAVFAHVCDLVALSLGAARGYREVAEQGGARAARLETIKADVAANLTDCALNVNYVATRHGVSPRYVQKLFAGEGTTFSEYVLGQRLAVARRLIGDPRFSGRSIASIAFDLGFSDLSYFNRTFRRRHEATPTEVRAYESSRA